MRRWSSITDSRVFARVLKQGRRSGPQGLRLVHLDAAPGAGFSLGLVVKRGTGTAVERNLIKRRLRAAADMLEPGDAELVIVADRRALAFSFQEMVALVASRAAA